MTAYSRWKGEYWGKVAWRKMTNGRIITQLGVCDRYVRSEEGAHIKRGLPVLSIHIGLIIQAIPKHGYRKVV